MLADLSLADLSEPKRNFLLFLVAYQQLYAITISVMQQTGCNCKEQQP
jgi:hypothetical protein